MLNHAENDQGKVLGPIDTICSRVVNETAGKFQVAPCFIPTAAAGPYWVDAFSEEEGWALVSGGPPTLPSGTACKTGSGENDRGP